VAWSGYFEKLLHQFGIDPPMWLMNDPITAAEKFVLLFEGLEELLMLNLGQ
jgi:APA family basic amino acid/polyamine antiporter